MSRRGPWFIFHLFLPCLALTFGVSASRAVAQDFAGAPTLSLGVSAPPEAEPPGETPAPVADTLAPRGQVLGDGARPPRRLELALTMAALVEVGILHGGTDNPRTSADESVTGIVGPFGGISLFLGHDVALFDGDASGMALGYLAMGLIGIDTPIGRGQTMIVQRHELALAMRFGACGILLGVGAVLGHLPMLGATVPGATLSGQLGFFAGPVWIGFPLGLDVWLPSGAPALVSETFAFTVGVSTL